MEAVKAAQKHPELRIIAYLVKQSVQFKSVISRLRSRAIAMLGAEQTR